MPSDDDLANYDLGHLNVPLADAVKRLGGRISKDRRGNCHPEYGLMVGPGMYEEICSVLAALRARPEARARDGTGWQDISTAPSDGTAFIGFLPQFSGYAADQRFQRCSWTGWGGGCWDCQFEKGGSGPTHWRPLPAAPVLTAQPNTEGRDA